MELLLDDARLSLEVVDRSRAKVLRGGVLGSRKGITLEGPEIETEPLTAADRENLKAASSWGVTAVMQSFTRSASDIAAVRSALGRGRTSASLPRSRAKAAVAPCPSCCPSPT